MTGTEFALMPDWLITRNNSPFLEIGQFAKDASNAAWGKQVKSVKFNDLLGRDEQGRVASNGTAVLPDGDWAWL